MKLRTCRPFTFSRYAGTQVPYSPVHFYFDNNTVLQQIDGDDKKIGSSTPNGIFWPSAKIQTQWDIRVGKWLSNIVVIISHDWLLRLLEDDDDCSYITNLLMSDKSFYFFEDINVSISTVLKELVCGFSRKISFIGKSDFVVRKAVYYNLFDEKEKEMHVHSIVEMDKENHKYRLKKIEMKNLLDNRSSVMEIEEIKFNPNISKEYFTTRYMERL